MRQSYLLGVHIFEPEDLELNSNVFLWPQKIIHVFELSDEVVSLCLLTGVAGSLCFKKVFTLEIYASFSDDGEDQAEGGEGVVC